ncbi:MAG: hypothetical protein RR846_10590 [Oscillospiraceae bacterium]
MNMIFRGVVTKIFVTLLLVLCLCSCMPKVTLESQISENESSGPSPYFKEELRLISHSAGLIFTTIACSDKGAYEVLINNDGTGQMLYYSFETMEKIILSSDISTSQEGQVSGVIPETLGGVMPLVADDAVLVMKSGHNKVTNSGSQQVPSYIYKMGLTGQEIKTFPLNPLNNIAVDSAIALGKDYLYYFEYTYSQEINGFEKSSLIAFDINTGKTKVVYQFSAKENVRIIGAKDDRLVLIRINDLEKRMYEILSFSITDNSMVTLANVSLAEQSYCAYEDNVYVYDTTTQNLSKVNIVTAVKEQICNLNNYVNSAYLYSNAYDGRLVLQCDVKGSELTAYCSYDLADNTLNEINLYFDYLGDKNFAGIIAETDKDFLILMGNKAVPTISKGTEGKEYKGTYYVPQYALISKTDYWNSVAEYRYFTDTVKY